MLIALTVIAAALVAYALSQAQPTLYEAEGEVLLSDPRTSGGIAEEIGLVLDPSRYVRNQAEVMRSPQVSAAAAESMDGTLSPSAIQESTSVVPARDLDSITIRAIQPTAERAVALVGAVVEGYETVVERSIQDRVEESITTLEASAADTKIRIAQYDALLSADPDDAVLEAQRTAAVTQLVTLESRIDALATNAALYGSGVQLYVPPEEPKSPVQPRPLRNSAIAGVLGLLAGGTVAWWRGVRKTHVEDREEPARILDAPLLGVVPDFSAANVDTELPAAFDPSSQPGLAYQFVASFVSSALERIGGKVVVVTSTGVGDGKTITAANCAVAAAGNGSYPLLIDADERTRGLTKLAHLGGVPGISDLVTGREEAGRVVHTWALPHSPILVAPAGMRTAGEGAHIRSVAFRDALSKLTVGRDLVIIDAPPLLAVAETIDLAAVADGVILVIRPGTPLGELEAARDQLRLSRATILGYVYNGTTPSTSGYGYGFAYGHVGRDERLDATD